MPIYTYLCLSCQTQDQRLGGLDDHTARCVACGGSMARQDPDYLDDFLEKPDCPWCTGPTPAGQPRVSHHICARHARELREEQKETTHEPLA